MLFGKVVEPDSSSDKNDADEALKTVLSGKTVTDKQVSDYTSYLLVFVKKKKKKLERQQQTFEERIRCDIETINRIIETGRAFKQKERQREEKDLLQTREEREKNGGQKDKEKEKKKEDRTRSGGGRSRDSR